MNLWYAFFLTHRPSDFHRVRNHLSVRTTSLCPCFKQCLRPHRYPSRNTCVHPRTSTHPPRRPHSIPALVFSKFPSSRFKTLRPPQCNLFRKPRLSVPLHLLSLLIISTGPLTKLLLHLLMHRKEKTLKAFSIFLPLRRGKCASRWGLARIASSVGIVSKDTICTSIDLGRLSLHFTKSPRPHVLSLFHGTQVVFEQDMSSHRLILV